MKAISNKTRLIIQFYLSLLDLSSAHLFLDELGQAVQITLAAILDAGIGSGLEKLQGGVTGNILSWNEVKNMSGLSFLLF